MTTRNPYGNGPQTKAGSIVWIAAAVFVLVGLIALKITGWIGWVVLLGLVPFPVLFGFVGVVGVTAHIDHSRSY